MKKTLVLFFLLFLVSVPSYALLHVGVNAGYAYANMDQLNNAWEDAKKEAQENSGSAKISDFGNSVYVNADLGLGLLPFINVGPRAGIQYVFPSTIDYDAGGFKYKETITSLLVPAELGISTNIAIPLTPFSVTAGIYGGYGFAFATKQISTNMDFAGGTLPYEFSVTQPFNGGGFMADASAALEINILPLINLSINAGYRYCLIENINTTKEIRDPISGNVLVSAGQLELYPGSDEKLKVNFSGFQIGAGLNIRF